MRPRWMRITLIAPLAVLGLLVFVALGGVVVQLLWNWLLPPLLGGPPITFWQALGLLALCRILFGGSGWRGPIRSNIRRRMEERCRQRMEERCATMTPEERERFRQRVRERWGFDPSAGESKEE